MAKSNPQLSAATALVQLLTEHPELPSAGWSIDTIGDELHGFVHSESIAALAAFQDVVGGGVRAANCYVVGGRTLRRHVLATVWRDVRVEVVVSLPVAEMAQVSA